MLVGAATLLAFPAFAGNVDPCAYDKINARNDGQQIVVNCYVDQAIEVLVEARAKIQADTPADEAGSNARWEAMAAIDAKIIAFEAIKIPEGKHIDMRIPDEVPDS